MQALEPLLADLIPIKKLDSFVVDEFLSRKAKEKKTIQQSSSEQSIEHIADSKILLSKTLKE